jgi:hypothetical protein
MGLSGSWFESSVVSSDRKALGPSWLVMFDDEADDAVELLVLDVDEPLLIRP